MGVLKKFEQRLEGLVNGTFAKVFKSEVQPVEIAGALQRECDNNATIWNRDRTVVPNDFIVELSTPDFERLSPYSGQLGDELAGMVRDYAKQQRYTFMGPIKVHLEKADDLDTGLYRVRSRTLASSVLSFWLDVICHVTSQSISFDPSHFLKAGSGSRGLNPGSMWSSRSRTSSVPSRS